MMVNLLAYLDIGHKISIVILKNCYNLPLNSLWANYNQMPHLFGVAFDYWALCWIN